MDLGFVLEGMDVSVGVWMYLVVSEYYVWFCEDCLEVVFEYVGLALRLAKASADGAAAVE